MEVTIGNIFPSPLEVGPGMPKQAPVRGLTVIPLLHHPRLLPWTFAFLESPSSPPACLPTLLPTDFPGLFAAPPSQAASSPSPRGLFQALAICLAPPVSAAPLIILYFSAPTVKWLGENFGLWFEVCFLDLVVAKRNLKTWLKCTLKAKKPEGNKPHPKFIFFLKSQF